MFSLCFVAMAVAPVYQTAQAQQISFQRPQSTQTITLDADSVARWQSGRHDVIHLRGNVRVGQGQLAAQSDEAIVWVEIPDAGEDEKDSKQLSKVVLYLEGNASVDLGQSVQGQGAGRIFDDTILERLFADSVSLKAESGFDSSSDTAIFNRATNRLRADNVSSRVGWPSSNDSRVSQAQFAEPLLVSPQTGQIMSSQSVLNNAPAEGQLEYSPGFGDSFQSSTSNSGNQTFPSDQFRTSGQTPAFNSSFQTPASNDASQSPAFSAPFQTPAVQNPPSQQGNFQQPLSQGGSRDSLNSGNISNRDSKVQLNAKSRPNPDNPDERITIIKGGFRATIDSPEFNQLEPFRADPNSQITILADNAVWWSTTLPNGEKIDELYLDGNVVFVKGKRTIKAQQMFYNVYFRQGTILDAEITTPVAGYAGTVKLKADVLRQLDSNNLQAIGAAFTTSRIGFPRYWLQSESLMMTRQPTQLTDDQTGAPLLDPENGQPQVGDDYFLQADSNKVYLNGLPVFYWPRLKANLSDRSIFLRQFRIGNDQIFGFQVGTGWDMYQLLNRRKPAGTDWIGKLDYLSERGVGFGTDFNYQRNGIFGYAGKVNGSYKSWFINDNGQDFLGAQRFGLDPEESFRGRTVGRHRHDFAPGFVLRAELGYISDRNFLEQFYEREWDTQKDATTGLWLERNIGTQSFNLTADLRINDFFTQTNWLPRFDHFMIGKPLFGDRVVWHNHSSLGYAKFEVADAPTNPIDLSRFDPLAWESEAEGIRYHTRHELDFPVQLGPTKLVPYVMGDLGFWQEDLNGNDTLRGTGQVGIRASVPIWKVDPNVQSTLWNVNGLAHKVSFDFDAFYADSSQDLDRLPLYDQLDDDAQEHFRRRFGFNTFGLIAGQDVPLRFDERYFALRSGLQSHVTSPSAEIVDDLAVVKFGVRQRWQTRRGTPGQQRVVDWITMDMEASFFPEADRDNFGSDFGVFNYDFRWHLGDRVSILSDGYADFFADGLRTVSVGAVAERPEIGSVFLGFRSIEGPISSNILTASMVYRMSDTWGIKGGTQVDFGETGTIGNRLGVVYIGESFLWEVGFNYDASRDNLGVRFGFEPRFAGVGRMFRPGGYLIPPASSRRLE